MQRVECQRKSIELCGVPLRVVGMKRRVFLVWATVALLALLLVLPKLAAASKDEDDTESAVSSNSRTGVEDGVKNAEEEEDDDWEDIEDDDEVGLAAASSRSANRAVKALPKVTDQNADRIVSSTEYVLLMGYASWCKQSAKVMIDFAEAATVLASLGSPVALAKVDGVANPVTASRFNIKGYPTILFLTNGSSEIYQAGQTRDDFVNWVLKASGLPATTFMSTTEAKELQKRKAPVVIGLFESFEGPEHEEFIAASKEVVDVEFLQTTNADAAKVFNEDFLERAPAVAIWKNVPEKFLKYGGELKSADLVPFVKLNKFELVTQLNARNSRKVYASPVNKQVILFANSYDYDSIYPYYLAAAKYFKGELLFVWVDIEDEDFAKPMSTMYGILGSEPTVAGFDNSNGSKYLLEAEVTRQSLKAFVINYKEGRLKLHYKSDPIPKKIKGDIKVIVGKTFEKLVLKSTKDVLLLVSTTHCYGCESVAKAFAKVAKHYKGTSSLLFAKIDATNNDHPALQVQNYPAILLYSASSKDSPPVEAPTKPTFKKLLQFVEQRLFGAVDDTTDEALSLETESISTPADSEAQNPTGTEGPESELKSSFGPDDSVSDSVPTTLESTKLTDTEDESILHAGVNPDIEQQQEIVDDNRNEASVANEDVESEVRSVFEEVAVLASTDITSDPKVSSLEPPLATEDTEPSDYHHDEL